MDFDQAIDAHVKWKTRLRACISGQEKLDPAEVAKDHVCLLGKWIHGEGTRYASLPMFAKLREDHAMFHRAAGAVARSAVGGRKAEAEKLLAAGGDYAKASTTVVSAIMRLRTAVPI